jgi:phosphopantothenate synthetase
MAAETKYIIGKQRFLSLNGNLTDAINSAMLEMEKLSQALKKLILNEFRYYRTNNRKYIYLKYYLKKHGRKSDKNW